MGRETDWISAICSVVAALVALITLVTVFVAAGQLLSRRQVYQLGLSVESLGLWKKKVLSRSFFGLKYSISTPAVSVPKLVSKGWKPDISFPLGFVIDPPKKAIAADPENQSHTSAAVMAEASWVNLLQCVGLTPKSNEYYDLQSQPDLVNGIVPMRWKGRDLVALCSILGFQAYEENPKSHAPMPLPMQWSGPLGWVQFRASSDGCIAEFRRRSPLQDQLPKDIHNYYNRNFPRWLMCLKTRFWYSVNAMPLSEDTREVLYIGGADPREERTQDSEVPRRRPMDAIFDELLETDRSPDEIRKAVWGSKAKQPDAVRSGALENGLSQLSSSAAQKRRNDNPNDTLRKFRVMKPSPGMLSVIVESNLIESRGLTYEKFHSYQSHYTYEDEVDEKSFPYQLSEFRMDEGLLTLVKKAALRVVPDGYYFTATYPLFHSFRMIWSHVEVESSRVDQHIFSQAQLDRWHATAEWGKNAKDEQLYHAMMLCNKFQHIRKITKVTYTIKDMIVMSRASVSLRNIVSPANMDLIWALIICADLFSDLVLRFGKMELQNVLAAKLTCENGWVDCGLLQCPEVDGSPTVHGKYKVPLLPDGPLEFSGYCVLAAFLDVFLNYFWIEQGWISDISLYDATIPQSVTMC